MILKKYDFKIEVVIIHLTTMFKLLVVLFIIKQVMKSINYLTLHLHWEPKTAKNYL